MRSSEARVRSAFVMLMACVLTAALLLTSACGKQPEPDTSIPSDVSTGSTTTESNGSDSNSTTDIGGDSTTDSGVDPTGSTVATSDPIDSDATVADTTVTNNVDDTGSSSRNTSGNNRTTTKPTKSSNTPTSSGSGGILVSKTTTSTTGKTGSTTTQRPQDQSRKGQILSLFDESMRGKTANFLIHYVYDSESLKMQQMYEETGVKVKFIIAENNTFGSRLAALINARSAPDVVYFNSEQYAPLVNKGVMTDLKQYDIDLSMEVYDQELMDIFTWNGKNYGLSTKNSNDAVFTVLFYNKTVFRRVGATDPGTLWKQGKWNWNTFVTCAQAVNDPGNGIWGCDLYDSSVYLCSGGVGIISITDGTIVNNLSDPRILNAWTFINRLHHEYKVTTALAGADENFASGKSIMMMGESWMWNASEPVATTKDDWGVVPAPLAPDVQPSAIINPRGACVPIGASNPELGLAVYTYWTSKDNYTDDAELEVDTDLCPHLDKGALNIFYSELWEMPKIADLSSGVIEYGGEYSRWDFSFDVFQAGMSGINSSIDKWKTAIDVSIKRILSEFS